MEQEQFVNGNEIVDYWGYLKSVNIFFFFSLFCWFSLTFSYGSTETGH